jgi:hypothetical protein
VLQHVDSIVRVPLDVVHMLQRLMRWGIALQ